MIGEAGVFWPFKALLQGSGIVITETGTSIQIGTTGAGPGGGDMLKSEYATNGVSGKVDHAVTADNVTGTVTHANAADTVPWGGITGVPISFPSDWSTVTNKPTTFPPSPHAPTHLPNGSDAIALASPSGPGLLSQLSGKTTDYVDGTNTCRDLVGIIEANLPATKGGGLNAIGNSNFETDQRVEAISSGVLAGGAAAWLMDRWYADESGLGGWKGGQQLLTPVLAGAQYALSQYCLGIHLTTPKGSLASGNRFCITHYVEGPVAERMIPAPTSLQLLVMCTSNLKFTVALQNSDSTGAHATVSLLKLCTLTANQWTLIQLPNLPTPPSPGAFNFNPGTYGYRLVITLASGLTYVNPVANTWITGDFRALSTQDNFFALPTGAWFYAGFVQHEPGPVCGPLIAQSTEANLDNCLRYFSQLSSSGASYRSIGNGGININQGFFVSPTQFPKPMCTVPSVSIWGPNGVANEVQVLATSQMVQVSQIANDEAGIIWIETTGGTNAPNTSIAGWWEADSGF